MWRLIILSLFSLSAFGSVNWSAKKQELKTRKPGMTSASSHKRITRAYHYMSKGEYPNAISLLEGLTKSVASRPFEAAKAWQTLAYAYAQSSKFPQAMAAFEKVLKIDALPLDPTLQSMFALSQLYAMKDKNAQALELMKGWIALSNKPNPDAYVFLATLYFEIKEQDKALELVEKAIAISKKPKDNWLAFAVSLYYQKKQYNKAVKYLKILAANNPEKKTYWSQLAGSLIQMDKMDQALIAMQLAFEIGLLKEESEIINIVSLYLQNDIPYHAAKFLKQALDKGMVKKKQKNYELLASSWVQARETALAMPALKSAAKLSEDGEIYSKIGALYLEQEKWNDALTSFNLALKKGKLKDQGQLYVYQAIASIQLKKFSQAKTYLDKSLNFKTTKDQAKQWLSYIDSVQ